MDQFTTFLQSFYHGHEIAAILILLFGFPEIELLILVILGVLALAGR